MVKSQRGRVPCPPNSRIGESGFDVYSSLIPETNELVKPKKALRPRTLEGEELRVYHAHGIQKILGFSKSKTYGFLEAVYET